MVAKMRIFGLVLLCFVAFAGVSLAQISSLEGDIKAEDGSAVKGAVVKIERKDIKGHYEVKSDKKGHYFYGGLPLGTYKVTLEIDGKVRDSVDNVRTQLGDPKEVNFNLKDTAAQQKALAQAVESGTLTKEQEHSLSAEQKAAIEGKAKEKSAAMAKNKALNDAFNQGKEAQTAKNYEAAVQSFEKANEMDATQHVIWGSLADSYTALSKTKAGAEQQAAQEKAVNAYGKAIELKPDDAAYHNNYALLLAQMKKFPEAEAELNKAAQIDPTNAGKYFFNLGAVLVNTNQADAAVEAFKKAIAADPNYADAYYQYGVSLVAKATTTPDGKIVPPPGTVEAFQKYLELKPDGPNAEAAKGMLATLGGTVQTEYKNPNAPKKPVKKK